MLVLVLLPVVVQQKIQKLRLKMRWFCLADLVKKLQGQQQTGVVLEVLLDCCHRSVHLP